MKRNEPVKTERLHKSKSLLWLIPLILIFLLDRNKTRLNASHIQKYRMPPAALQTKI